MKPLFWPIGLAVCLSGTVASTAHVGADKGSTRAALTYHKDVAPILRANCASCHRPGDIGPFSLTSYADVKKRAQQIAQVTGSGFMPPWHAASHGEFLDETKLTPAQVDTIRQWAANGAPEGIGSEKPIPPAVGGWSLGKPDLVLKPSGPFTLGAEGADLYRCFVLPTGVDKDTYITAMEVHPGNKAVVHHVIAYIDTTGKARDLDAADPEPGYTAQGGGIGISPNGAIGGWAPGNLARPLPTGVGLLLPAKSDIVLQTHYHRSGKVERDQTEIGIYFAKGAVDKRLRIMPMINLGIKIPAGDPNYTANAYPMPVLSDISVLQVMPHMHLLGKSMAVSAALPDHTTKQLVEVPNWDFNWQNTYAYKEPVKLQKGAFLNMTAHYDNSEANIKNPSRPLRTVTWGEQTTDEMCLALVYYTVDAEHLTKGVTADGMFEFGGSPKSNKKMIGQLIGAFLNGGGGSK